MRSAADYRVGWICALPLEKAAASLVLDASHPPLFQPRRDQNSYTLGEISGHNVVIACLPAGSYGTTSAAVVAANMRTTFPAINIGLMVGIGGGVPSARADVRLGDVVVSQPQGQHPGVVQYDFGKTISSGRFERTGSLNRPPPELLTALATVQTTHMTPGSGRLQANITAAMARQTQTSINLFRRPKACHDRLYEASYFHQGTVSDCRACGPTSLVQRPPRPSDEPVVHYGTIASGNQVMRDGLVRDQLAGELGVLCFEMEAAGLMNHFPCLVVRGICDYADSHKSKEWQAYAALTAAAFAKELLTAVPLQAGYGGVMQSIPLCPEARFTVRFQSIDLPPVRAFIGRETEMAKIKHALRPDSTNHIATLQGISGIGKTHIALAYVMQHINAYSAIFWLDASNADRLAWSYLEMAKRITMDHDMDHDWDSELKQILDSHDTTAAIVAIRKWLSLQSNNRWLLVYDAYEPDLVTKGDDQTKVYDLKDFLPLIRQGHIIITTTKPGMDFGVQIPVGKLRSREHSLGILSHASERQDLDQDQSIRDLIVELDGLPQALVTVGAFLRNSTISCHDYLLLYRAQWHRHEGEAHIHSLPAYLAWGVTMKKIACNHEVAAYLAYYWSIFSNHHIWPKLLQHARDTRLAAIGRDLETFFNAMRVLCDYGVAEVATDTVTGRTINSPRVYVMHQCVHQWLYSVNRREPLFTRHTDIVLRCVSSYSRGNRLNIADTQQFLSHADRCLQLIDLRVMGADMRNIERYAHIYSNIADYYMAASQWVTAASPGTRALLKCASARAHRYIAKWYSDHLNDLYLAYPEKRHLVKVERLCLLALEVAAKAPAGDELKYINTKVKVYNMLREVYDIQKKLFKASRCELALLRLEYKASLRPWYRKPLFLILLVLYIGSNLFRYAIYYAWVGLVLMVLRHIADTFRSHDGLGGPVSAVLVAGFWIAWLATLRRRTARWITFVPWLGFLLALGFMHPWPLVVVQLFVQLIHLGPILLFEGLA
ncbi:uncharacterized protein BDV14DRAFT_199300 [Aspergillus stella-maris]|uniref:uncharacterized protein n=1 Tax=Aspergillus stella-maris TaxID=1810926 RepID=UPI003CCD5CD5